MPSHASPSPRRLVRESGPLALVLVVWLLPTAIVPGETAQALLVAGLVVAGRDAIVRGTHLARVDSPTSDPPAVAEVLRENVRLLGLAAVWLVVAQVVRFAGRQLPGHLTTDAVGALVVALNWTAVGLVVLYAVTTGRSRLATDRGGGPAPDEGDAGGQAPADG